MPPPVEMTLDRLPAFWDRSVVFVANLLSLFFGNAQQRQVLEGEIHWLDSYDGRLAPILNLLFRGTGNVLVVDHRPHPQLLDYFTDELGLSLPELVTLPADLYRRMESADPHGDARFTAIIEELRGYQTPWVDGFVTDAGLSRLAQLIDKQTITTPDGSRNGNNKVLLHEFMDAAGFPVFDTLMADEVMAIGDSLAELATLGYTQAVVKSAIGASGIGLVKLPVDGDPSSVPDYVCFEGPCMVQGWLDSTVEGVDYFSSPSVQMFVGDDTITVYDLTEQILGDDSVHEGNVSPPPYLDDLPQVREHLFTQARVVADWLHGLGYRGTASGDFHVVKRHNAFEVRICEVNARVTGATYPAVLARLFRPDSAWMMRNVRFPTSVDGAWLLQQMHRHGWLFKRDGAFGILPINFNLDRAGTVRKGQFLALGGTVVGCQELLEKMQDDLETAVSYDRD